MILVILISSVYAFLETAITAYLEYTQNNNKKVGIILYILSVFCLTVPVLVV